MSEKENKDPISSKLESSQEHARQALEATKKAAKTTLDVGKEQFSGALKESKDHVVAAAQDIGEVAGAKYGEVRDQVRNLAEDYRGKAQQVIQSAGTRVQTLQDDAEVYIRENPLQAVAIAAGVGFVLGLLIRR